MSRYIEQRPETINFAYTEFGKPLFNNASFTQQIEFNVSHSHGRAAFAFTLSTPIGIDLEYKLKRKYIDKIAYRFFPARNYEQLKRLTGDEKLNTFFKMWVHNEAILKAFGYHLRTHPFSKYRTQTLQLKKNFIAEKNTYSFSLLALHPDFAAALAIKGKHSKPIIIKEYGP